MLLVAPSVLAHDGTAEGERAPESNPSHPVGGALSSAMWGLDWSKHFPLKLTDDGIWVRASSLERVVPFVAEHGAAIFEEDAEGSPFLRDRATTTRAEFYRRCADFFEFTHDGAMVGAFIGNPTDWSTYYLRFAAFLPQYQGRQLLQRFFPILFDVLGALGVERVDTETSPSNLPMMHIVNRFRFNTTGIVLSDRWGAVVRFTKFLAEANQDVFLRQFCTGIRYQGSSRPSHRDKERRQP